MTKIKPQECLVAIFTFNNGVHLKRTLEKIPKESEFKYLVHVDGSNDGSDECLPDYPYEVIRQSYNKGIGKSIKNVIRYAIDHKFKVLVVIPGNNKNNPDEAGLLIDQIISHDIDYVQGSRYLDGGKRDHTPLFRLIMVKVHAFLFTIITRRKCTDALEGFRAYKLSLFTDYPGYINIWQDWLDTYEFETYLHYKVLKKREFKFKEIAVSKIYPKNKKHLFNKNGEHYSHIRPIVDWWRILRPILLLILGIRK